ncbi:response regulator transcription factor [Arthrobacter sp. LAPM80]|uniref:LuxR C-terminal-related transcriptional regulator n=1 Tax=Arthrobacter sp. LAPM80 TaxID=3141788 RepID=UPI00398AC31D
MRLIIAEDSALFREGLSGLLEAAGHEVLAAVADATQAVEQTRALRPELVIFDVRMPPENTDDGARAAVTLRGEFLDILCRVRDGGSAFDPELVLEIMGAARQNQALESLTSREREVLALMAEGRTKIGITQRLWLTARTVETHVANTREDHRSD